MKLDPRFVSVQRHEINYLRKKFHFWERKRGVLNYEQVKELIIHLKKHLGKSRIKIYKYLRATYTENA